MSLTDEQFFMTFLDRQARIRKPEFVQVATKQRSVRFETECFMEFMQLGPHKRDRRRILLWRVPRDNPWYNPQKPPILKIPYLLFGDETVEDRDDILLPLIHQVMMEARV